MKVNLECVTGQTTDLRNGYLNISSVPIQIPENLPEQTQFIVGRYDNLDHILKEEVDEIIFNPFLNTLDPANMVEIFAHWVSKLKNGGILSISFLDIKRIAKDIHTEQMQIQGIHNAIYGPTGNHKCLIYTGMIKPLAVEFKLDIESITIKDIFVTVIMKKKEGVKHAKN